MESKQIEILLVEDNSNDAELTIMALTENNLANRLIHLKDGVEALEFIFGTGAYSNRNINDKPRVILLDINMPRIDGIEVLRKIQSDERTRLIPVVILASSKEDRDILESYNLRGSTAIIVKPVDFDKFCHAVSKFGFYWLLLNQAP